MALSDTGVSVILKYNGGGVIVPNRGVGIIKGYSCGWDATPTKYKARQKRASAILTSRLSPLVYYLVPIPPAPR